MADTRQKKDSVVPADVSGLIEESQKVQGWIHRLEEHEGEVRPEVYRRVRADYEGRLERVGSQLGRYRADLVADLERRRAELASLREERESHAADVEEARLRHTVGEYSDEEWEERREGIEASLEEAEQRLEVEAAAVEELAGIISSIGSGVSVPEAASPAAAERRVPEAAGPGERAAEAGERSEGAVEAARAAGTGGAGEAGAGAKKATAATGEEATGGAPAEAGAPKRPPADARSKEEGRAAAEPPAGAAREEESGDYLDELEFLESLSLDEADRFDAVSAMLDEEESGDSAEKKEG